MIGNVRDACEGRGLIGWVRRIVGYAEEWANERELRWRQEVCVVVCEVSVVPELIRGKGRLSPFTCERYKK